MKKHIDDIINQLRGVQLTTEQIKTLKYIMDYGNSQETKMSDEEICIPKSDYDILKYNEKAYKEMLEFHRNLLNEYKEFAEDAFFQYAKKKVELNRLKEKQNEKD